MISGASTSRGRLDAGNNPAALHPHPLPHPLYPPGEFKHALTALKSILLKEGRRGLFAGYGSFLLRDLPFDAIEFVSYEQMKKR